MQQLPIVGLVVALIITLGSLYKAGPDAWRLVKLIGRAPELAEAILETPKRIEALEVKVTYEFSNNGGRSLRDQVDAAKSLAAQAFVVVEASAKAVGVDMAELRADMDASLHALNARDPHS